MTLVNRGANLICDLLMAPFRPLGPWAAMLGISLVSSAIILWVFKVCSNQDKLRRAKGRAIARFLELLLFRDDFWVSLSALGRILRTNLTYLRFVMVPFVVVLPPVALLLVQLSCWYSNRPLREGEEALVKVHLQETGVALRPAVSLACSDGIEIETAGLWIPSAAEIDWRVRGRDGSTGWVEVRTGADALKKEVVVGEVFRKLSTSRVGLGLWDQFENPLEVPLPADGPVKRIEIKYPRRELRIGRLNIHWILAFFVLTLAFGLALKRPMRVEL